MARTKTKKAMCVSIDIPVHEWIVKSAQLEQLTPSAYVNKLLGEIAKKDVKEQVNAAVEAGSHEAGY